MFRNVPVSKYFNGKMTAEQMKKEYRKLALLWHPDINKAPNALEVMKEINSEYAYWYSRAASQEVHTKKTEENPDRDYSKYTTAQYIESLEAMIKWIYDNNIDQIVDVDLVGVFIWIAGITPKDVEIREKVKSVGFQGSFKWHDDGSKEYMWKWTPEIRRFNSNPNIDDIKSKYGSQEIKRGKKKLA